MYHTCELVYRIGGNNIKYGAQKGICRITGKESIGISFNEWVKAILLEPKTSIYLQNATNQLIFNRTCRNH